MGQNEIVLELVIRSRRGGNGGKVKDIIWNGMSLWVGIDEKHSYLELGPDNKIIEAKFNNLMSIRDPKFLMRDAFGSFDRFIINMENNYIRVTAQPYPELKDLAPAVAIATRYPSPTRITGPDTTDETIRIEF
jgi:hypothetical protein